MRISAHHCNRHVSKASCLNAMDPYCGWNELQEACTAPPNGDTLARYWVQNSTTCPLLTAGYNSKDAHRLIRAKLNFLRPFLALLTEDGQHGENGTNVRKHLVRQVMTCHRPIRVFVERDLAIIQVRKTEVPCVMV